MPLLKKPSQVAKILYHLRLAKFQGYGWISGNTFLHKLYISQFHARIFWLEHHGYVIEHSAAKDEFGFVSYRLISEPKEVPLTPVEKALQNN